MKQKIMKWIAWSTIGVSLLLYVLACALPSGVNVGIDPEDEVEGFWCLAGGWTAVFASIAGLSKHPLFAIWNVFVSLFLWGSNILYFWSIIDTLRAKVRSSRTSAFGQFSLGCKLSGHANRSRDSLVE